MHSNWILLGKFSILILVLLLGVSFMEDGSMDAIKRKDDSEHVMSMFRQRLDAQLVEEVLNFEPRNMTETEAMYKFYTLISFPLQGVCRVLKRIGGHWYACDGCPGQLAEQVDGDYFVCMDNIIKNYKKSFLIYSFGVNNDWAFEDFMDFLGCEIHAHDPTVDFPATRGENIHFYKLGLGATTEGNMETLENIFKKNGHIDTEVEILKIDIEGSELLALPNLLATGALDNVKQLTLEFHLPEQTEFISMLKLLQQLYHINFRIIAHDVNKIVGPGHSRLYHYVILTLMKDEIWT